jgi:hypothetical protein
VPSFVTAGTRVEGMCLALLTFLMRRHVVEAWDHPAEDVEAGPLAPAVGFTRALGHTSTFQGEPNETGNDVAHHQQLEESHAPRIPVAA